MAKGKEGRLMVRDFRNDERKRCTELQIQDVSHWKSVEESCDSLERLD